MKNLLFYIVVIVLIVFLIPILFTKRFENSEYVSSNNLRIDVDENVEIKNNENEKNKISNNNDINKNNYDYKQYNTVKVLHTKTGEIEEINLDEYLYGVVSAEMPASFENEALKAQSIVARTYTIYKIMQNNGKHEDADICDASSCCQAWLSKEDRLSKWDESERESNWTKIVNAVNETKGKIIVYNGQPINAFFHSNSGGNTESPVNVWGGSMYPYLQSVETSGEDAYNQYKSEVTMSKEELINKMNQNYDEFEINFEDDNAIKVLEYTEGKRVKTIKIGNINLSGVEARTIFGLKSANFEISIHNSDVTFSVIGYGHGVGMSQTGADSLAKQGMNYEQIITHFYTDVGIINL